MNTRNPKRIERTIGALNREHSLHDDEHREQCRKPHKAGCHPLKNSVIVEREGKHDHHDKRKRCHLVEQHSTTRFNL
jgi:hypothetical protein